MPKVEKYRGIIPALYAAYDDNGDISPERVKKLARYYANKGVKGLYVGGSSGENIYQSIEERKLVLESVVEEVGDELTIIAQVASPSTRASVDLATHASSLEGVDALSAVPPYYFVLPEEAIREYWTAMIEVSDLDFFIYNIPQTTNYTLTKELYAEMLKLPQVKGIKNSSMPVEDIYNWRNIKEESTIVFNGPDEQYIAGRIMGADGGIGGTYGAMPELFIAADKALKDRDLELARKIQYDINRVINRLTSGEGHMYAVIKAILEKKDIQLGGVRAPLSQVTENDQELIDETAQLIDELIEKYA